MRAEQKLVDSPMTLPFTKTASQIALNTGSGLIAFLCGLGEKFQDDGQCRFRNIFQMLPARHRLSRDMAVNPLHGIGRSEGKASGKHCTRELGMSALATNCPCRRDDSSKLAVASGQLGFSPLAAAFSEPLNPSTRQSHNDYQLSVACGS